LEEYSNLIINIKLIINYYIFLANILKNSYILIFYLKYFIKNLLFWAILCIDSFLSTPIPPFLIASSSMAVTVSIFKIENLSRNNLITHLVENIICFLIVMGIATSLVIPPIFNGNNKTSGVILVIATKNINKGSIDSFFFN